MHEDFLTGDTTHILSTLRPDHQNRYGKAGDDGPTHIHTHIHPISFCQYIFNRHGTIDMEAFSPGDARASTAKTPEPFKVNGKGGGIFMETIHRYQVALGSG